MLCFLITSVLWFAILPYYWREVKRLSIDTNFSIYTRSTSMHRHSVYVFYILKPAYKKPTAKVLIYSFFTKHQTAPYSEHFWPKSVSSNLNDAAIMELDYVIPLPGITSWNIILTYLRAANCHYSLSGSVLPSSFGAAPDPSAAGSKAVARTVITFTLSLDFIVVTAFPSQT